MDHEVQRFSHSKGIQAFSNELHNSQWGLPKKAKYLETLIATMRPTFLLLLNIIKLSSCFSCFSPSFHFCNYFSYIYNEHLMGVKMLAFHTKDMATTKATTTMWGLKSLADTLKIKTGIYTFHPWGMRSTGNGKHPVFQLDMLLLCQMFVVLETQS